MEELHPQEEKTLIIPGSKNTISIVEKSGKRRWQYAIQPKGKLYNMRTIFTIVYLAFFFLMPFIKYKGNPYFQFNFPERTFILFGNIFTPQDFIILGISMLVALLFVIVFTLAYGRVFCGWACPQTIFLEMIFRRIEYWIEGPANKQKIADKGKWTTEMYIRKAIKHFIYLVISFIIANTFLAWIIGVDALKKIITEPISQHIGGFIAIIIFTIVFFAVFAFIREIVCIVVCPYGRLQSVLLDKNSIVVAYDHKRGEPRSKKRGADGAGDCIDCNMCVNVCPTGIDIRNGTQLECVNCTACIDACNMMMKTAKRPPNLIKFASENDIEIGSHTKITWRIKAYSAALIVLLGLLTTLLVTRSVMHATVLRVPGQVMRENPDGTISNMYRIKVNNKSNQTMPYHIELVDNKDAKIEYVGKTIDSLKSGEMAEEVFFVKIPNEKITKRKQELRLNVMSGDKVMEKKELIFIGQY